MNDLTLHLPKGEASVSVVVDAGRLLVHNADYSIDFGLSAPVSAQSLGAQLRAWAAQLDDWTHKRASAAVSRPRSHWAIENWDWLTPQMVIDYFEQSEVLSVHAAEVRAVLTPMLDGNEQAEAQLAKDVAACAPYVDELLEGGELVYGGQSRIARILGLTNGGSHRQRILAVADELVSSTTSTTARRWVEVDSGPIAA